MCSLWVWCYEWGVQPVESWSSDVGNSVKHIYKMSKDTEDQIAVLTTQCTRYCTLSIQCKHLLFKRNEKRSFCQKTNFSALWCLVVFLNTYIFRYLFWTPIWWGWSILRKYFVSIPLCRRSIRERHKKIYTYHSIFLFKESYHTEFFFGKWAKL